MIKDTREVIFIQETDFEWINCFALAISRFNLQFRAFPDSKRYDLKWIQSHSVAKKVLIIIHLFEKVKSKMLERRISCSSFTINNLLLLKLIN